MQWPGATMSPTRSTRRRPREQSLTLSTDRVTAETAERAEGAGPAAALAAARARLGLVALLLALAGIGWWWTSEQMRGMDNGPWTALRALGSVTGGWVATQ